MKHSWAPRDHHSLSVRKDNKKTERKTLTARKTNFLGGGAGRGGWGDAISNGVASRRGQTRILPFKNKIKTGGTLHIGEEETAGQKNKTQDKRRQSQRKKTHGVEKAKKSNTRS